MPANANKPCQMPVQCAPMVPFKVGRSPKLVKLLASLQSVYTLPVPTLGQNLRCHIMIPIFSVPINNKKWCGGTGKPDLKLFSISACLQERSCSKCRARSEHCHWCPTLQRYVLLTECVYCNPYKTFQTYWRSLNQTWFN